MAQTTTSVMRQELQDVIDDPPLDTRSMPTTDQGHVEELTHSLQGLSTTQEENLDVLTRRVQGLPAELRLLIQDHTFAVDNKTTIFIDEFYTVPSTVQIQRKARRDYYYFSRARFHCSDPKLLAKWFKSFSSPGRIRTLIRRVDFVVSGSIYQAARAFAVEFGPGGLSTLSTDYNDLWVGDGAPSKKGPELIKVLRGAVISDAVAS